ncbi:hypothetical protein BFP72_08560 [Reichenbachiella sp. 5M10]|uniref:META domain-containing protein n=1 Tax=Reichenbachiella sp. 5M10 TaxID=1889772 RepID=UPI000C146CF5|nr:META domain-containing protein [Reichenbachiella sp. 5M10]PIB35443.1 hypothetical protein BFP72_08560 [Reichenbachiella sp. 5M10]
MNGRISSIIMTLVYLCSCTALRNENNESFEYRTDLIWVNSYKIPCASVGKSDCFLTQVSEMNTPSEQWRPFYNDINNFDFTPGYLYLLKVRIDFKDSIAANGNFYKYTLMEEVSKSKDYSLWLDQKWRFVTIDSDNIAMNQEEDIPTLQFNSTDYVISGTTGCNNFSGTFRPTYINKIKIGPVVATRKMCPDMAHDNAILSNFPEVSEYSIHGDTLRLRNSNGKSLMTLLPIK